MNEFIKEKADAARKQLILTKSSDKYRKEIESFQNWQRVNTVQSIDKCVILAYYSELSQQYEPSSLWTKLSMLKTMLPTHENFDISSYAVVKSFMKRNSAGHVPKQTKTFTGDQNKTFLQDALDGNYLPYKQQFFGIFGGCRREELYSLTVDAVVDAGPSVVVSLPKTRTHRSRTLTIVDGDGMNYLDMIRKYRNIRPQHITRNHFFINYRKGKCTDQRIGINSFGDRAKSDHWQLCWLISDIRVLKRHEGWKSTSVAEKYIEDSLEMKKQNAKMIQGITAQMCLSMFYLHLRHQIALRLIAFFWWT